MNKFHERMADGDTRNALIRSLFPLQHITPYFTAAGLLVVGALPSLNALFMAFATEAMIFISLHELVPMARRYQNLPAFALGSAPFR